MKKKIQSFFRCTVTASETVSSNANKRIIFQGSNENFIKNGGVLLEESISLFHGKTNPIRCLSVDDLNTKFEDWILWDRDGFGNWYKCVWEGRPILIMIFIDDRDIFKYEPLQRSCREIVIAAQMGNHRNVHKLLACCLETEYPLLVYEFVENGSLSNRILAYENQDKPPLEWEDRLRIAWEISHAVAYLHTAFTRPIIHRDLKPSNVFLDQHNVAKLTHFNLSVSIPEGKTSLEVDSLVGTYGYMAPEYVLHSKVMEKLDVYSFGVLFFELLTEQRYEHWVKRLLSFPLVVDPVTEYVPVIEFADDDVSESDNEQYKSFIARLRESLQHNLKEVVTGYGVATPNEDLLDQQLQVSVDLLLRCIAKEEDSRPTMEEVATELKDMITSSSNVIYV